MNKKLAISLVILTLVVTVSAGRKKHRAPVISDRLSREQTTQLFGFYGKKNVEGMSANQQRRFFAALQSATPEQIAATKERYNKRK